MKKVVSIITPAYHCEETIDRTYRSIRSQTFENWEWVVVEDHSPDDSYERIKAIAEKDERVVVLRTPVNSGAAVARNVGIAAANGRYIAFLDADDFWDSKKLEKQIQFMEEKGAAFSFTNYRVCYNGGKCKPFLVRKDEIRYADLLKTVDIGCLTAMYDSEKLGKRYMPLDCPKREDHGAWLDITRDGTIAYRLPEILATYTIAGSSVSSNKFKMFSCQYRLYRRHENFGRLKSLFFTILVTINKILKSLKLVLKKEHDCEEYTQID